MAYCCDNDVHTGCGLSTRSVEGASHNSRKNYLSLDATIVSAVALQNTQRLSRDSSRMRKAHMMHMTSWPQGCTAHTSVGSVHTQQQSGRSSIAFKALQIRALTVTR